MKYIDAEKLIERLEDMKQAEYENCGGVNSKTGALQEVQELITSLQQEPRFPQYDNIVEKIFGAGNLEGWERDEAEMLVALAKEELLKSLQQEQPEVELERELRDYFSKWDYSSYDGVITMGNGIVATLSSIQNVARHFYELARQKYEK
jgi:hypothetical protein